MKIKDIIHEGLGDLIKNVGARMRYIGGAAPEEKAGDVAGQALSDYEKFEKGPGEDSRKYQDWLKQQTRRNLAQRVAGEKAIQDITNKPLNPAEIGKMFVKKVVARPQTTGVPFGTEVPVGTTGFATKGQDGGWYDEQGNQITDPATVQRHEQYALRRQAQQAQTAQMAPAPASPFATAQRRGGRRR